MTSAYTNEAARRNLERKVYYRLPAFSKVQATTSESSADEIVFQSFQMGIGEINDFATDERKSLWSFWSAIFGLVGLAFGFL